MPMSLKASLASPGAKNRCRDCDHMEKATQAGVCPFRKKYMNKDRLRYCRKFWPKGQQILMP